jgi:hypothetical protein
MTEVLSPFLRYTLCLFPLSDVDFGDIFMVYFIILSLGLPPGGRNNFFLNSIYWTEPVRDNHPEVRMLILELVNKKC